MLIPMILVSDGLMQDPLLYLSVYFKQHRARYYELLQRVRMEGDWEAWLEFFFEGVRATAQGAFAAAKALADMFQKDRKVLQELHAAPGSALRVHEALQKRAIQNIASLSRATGLSVPTVQAAVSRMEELGMVVELSGKLRGKLYGYRQYLHILEAGAS